MSKHYYSLFLFCIFCCNAFSQNLPLPEAHPIAIAAPHLPLMIRYEGQGIVFNIENNKYKFEGNEGRLKNWMKTYPDELSKYKDAIAIYLKNISFRKLANENKELYIDLKSQWLLITQF